MAEIALMWNLMIVESLPRRPLILVGDGWQSIFDQVFQSTAEYTSASAKELLLFAKDVETAVTLVES